MDPQEIQRYIDLPVEGRIQLDGSVKREIVSAIAGYRVSAFFLYCHDPVACGRKIKARDRQQPLSKRPKKRQAEAPYVRQEQRDHNRRRTARKSRRRHL